MSHETLLAIARFENRNGVISWRVTGSINGVRVRRNFKSREEAAAEKAALEIKSAQATAGMRSALTFLSDERLREAEDAFRKLEGRKRTLLFYLDYAFTFYREPEHEKTVADAVSTYVAVICAYATVHSQTGYLVYSLLFTVPLLAWTLGSAATAMKLFPSAQFGQFSGALNVFGCGGMIFGSVLIGMLMDLVHNNYRIAFLWTVVFRAAAIIPMVLVIHGWIQHGGPKNYVAPLPQ